MSTESVERKRYIKGFLFALIFTAFPFVIAIYTSLPVSVVYWTIGIFAIMQLVVHLHYFLHIDLSKQKREDLQLILFSAGLLSIMVGGTLWVLGDLSHRMH